MTKKQRETYFSLWRAACKKHGWDPAEDAERHAFHVQVFGYNISTKEMDNKHVDRVFHELRRLIDPDDLEAAMFQDDPGKEERKRLLWRIEQTAARGYIQTISQARFKTADYEKLGLKQLTQLRNTLANRMAAKRKKSLAVAVAA